MLAHISSLTPKRWKGYRLIAGDGSTISLPASTQIKNHFGIYSVSQGGTSLCHARTCMFYDVLSGYVIDSMIAPASVGEITLINTMVNTINDTDSIVILDRGFGYFSTCKNLINQKQKFCIRVTTSQSMFSKLVLSNPSDDFITEWIASDAEKVTCKKYGWDTKSITVRVTKIVLRTGEIELLVSSLFDMDLINKNDLRELYELRWNVEEGFKKLKPKMKLEQFGCKRYEGVYQEFYAHIFMMNLVSIIANDTEENVVEKTKHRKHHYKYNWQNAFLFVREKIVDLFNSADPWDILEKIMENIATSIIAVKKGRHFVRDIDGKRRRAGYSQCYK